MNEKPKLEINYEGHRCLLCRKVYTTSFLIVMQNTRPIILCMTCAANLKKALP